MTTTRYRDPRARSAESIPGAEGKTPMEETPREDRSEVTRRGALYIGAAVGAGGRGGGGGGARARAPGRGGRPPREETPREDRSEVTRRGALYIGAAVGAGGLGGWLAASGNRPSG